MINHSLIYPLTSFHFSRVRQWWQHAKRDISKILFSSNNFELILRDAMAHDSQIRSLQWVLLSLPVSTTTEAFNMAHLNSVSSTSSHDAQETPPEMGVTSLCFSKEYKTNSGKSNKTTKPVANYWSKVLWSQVCLQITLCLDMMFVMTNPSRAVKSTGQVQPRNVHQWAPGWLSSYNCQ